MNPVVGQCPTGDQFHQPHPNPWWSGISMFMDRYPGVQLPSPASDFFHVVFEERAVQHLRLGANELLMSPAQRRVLPSRFGQIAGDGRLNYKSYDVHAVYVTTVQPPGTGEVVYRVEPVGPIWPDPEQAHYTLGDITSWCCSQAKIVEILHDLQGMCR